MKREVLFRGKRKDNWVYGYYNYCGKNNVHEIISEEYDYIGVSVDKETIGQFTGLTDKNGVKIFENDKTNYGIIIFKHGCFGIDGSYGFVEISNWNLSHIEIIGNIHE